LGWQAFRQGSRQSAASKPTKSAGQKRIRRQQAADAAGKPCGK
jgi:hypothetical protein